MKKIMNISVLISFLFLTSCSHFQKGCCKNDQCKMKEGKCQDQCPMKKEAPQPEVKK